MAFILSLLYVLILSYLIYKSAYLDNTQSAEAIIVLGASQWNGDPSPVFKSRLDHAYLLHQQGYARYIILTGGVGEGESISEAEVGRNYLLRRGAEPDNILMETEGQTTWQSLANVADISSQNRITKVILVSDGFHMFRLNKMAGNLGFIPLNSPAKNSPITNSKMIELRYVLREVAVFTAYILFRI